MDLAASSQAATNAAQAISVLIGTPWSSVFMMFAVALVGLIGLPMFKQHAIEILDAKYHLPLWLKMLAPTGLSMLSGAILKMMGVDGATALAAIPSLAILTHVVNETPLALNLNGKLPQTAQDILKAAGDATKASMIFLVLMLGAASLRADVVAAPVAPVAGWCAGPALWAGSSLYQTTGGSTLTPAQSALGGFEFAGYLGSWQGEEFSPAYTLGVVGAMNTAGAVNSPAAGVTGGFYLNGVPVTLFAAKLLTDDAGGLIWGVGTNVQFSGWVPFLYLGHPGN